MIDREAQSSSTCTRRVLAAVVVAAALATLVVLYCRHLYEVSTESEEKARRLDEFCAKTRNAMLEDRRAFASGDDRERTETRRRFYASEVMYHSSQSVEICLSPLPKTPSQCFLVDDWRCLGDFAGSIAQSIWQKYGRVE